MARTSGASAVFAGLSVLIVAAILGMTLGFTIAVWERVQKNDVINSGKRVFLEETSCPAGEDRRKLAYTRHEQIAYAQYARGVPCHADNGDETLYPATRAGSYSKVKIFL